ncbi:MAG: DUF192 domain-containing protein [Verrucomicrobiota bacterium]
MCQKIHSPVNTRDKFYLKNRLLVWGLMLLAFTLPSLCQSGPQDTLPTIELRVGGKKISAEVADEDRERATGLMFRESLGENSGMLFVMPQPGPAGFWMKNTKVPLTIAYLDARGVIMELHDLEPHNESPVPSRFRTIAYALEMSRGWFTKNNIWPGERIEGLPSLETAKP